MPDRRLQVFHTVARLLSFTNAAKLLEMTQPAVTFQVRQLEEEFKARLFDRSHNRIDLTEAGRCVYEYAEKIFNVYGEMEQAVRDVTGQVGGALRMGAAMLPGNYRLPTILSDYARLFPQVHFSLKVSNTPDILTLVEQSFLDLGIVEGETDSKTLESVLFRKEQYHMILPSDHPWAKEQRIDFTRLAEQTLLLTEEGYAALAQYQHLLPETTRIVQMGSPETVKTATEKGCGLGFLPESAIAREKRFHVLHNVPFAMPVEVSFYFVFKKQKFPLRVLSEFIDFALSSTREEEALRAREMKRAISKETLQASVSEERGH